MEIRAATPKSSGAVQIANLLKDPRAKRSSLLSPSGSEVNVPEGSIEQYLYNHLTELGGMTGYVQVVVHAVNPPLETPITLNLPNLSEGQPSEEDTKRLISEELKKRGLPLNIIVTPNSNKDE
jgi:hypothetical protein